MKASFVLSTYRTPLHLLKRAIDSFFAQKEKDIELIVINAGPIDETDSYLKSLQGEKLIYLYNKGVSVDEARNLGIQIARGDYVGFIDSDDYFENDFASIMLNAIIKNDADIVDCSFFIDSKKIKKNTLRKKHCILDREKALRMLMNDVYFRSFLWCKMFKRSLFEKERRFFKEPHVFEDLPFCVECIIKSNKVVYLEEPLYHYQKGNPNSATSTSFLKRPLDHIESFLLSKEIVAKTKDKKLLDIMNASLPRCLLSLAYDFKLAHKAGMTYKEITSHKREFRLKWSAIK